MLDFLIRPIRSVLGGAERDAVESLHETRDIEANMLGAVRAIENATESIEKHVAVIETLATSVDPLRASVDRLTDTMQELVGMMAPMATAEHEMHRVGRFFGRHHHDEPPTQDAQPEPSRGQTE
jgi:methyl-accepting chemotaxis protein